ncbi:MAG: hypothetical protein ACXQTV_04305 [Candidatus Hecatellaceae archaeon]
MVECPRCKSTDVELTKSWDVKPKSGRGRAIRVSMYLCHSCNHKFRKAVKLEEAVQAESPATVEIVQPTATTQITATVETDSNEEQKESFLDKLKRSFHIF